MAQLDFPYGKKRDWELDTADADIGLKSVPESLVVLQSLRQSRDKWISRTFAKFTSKARGAKAPEPPPPHTIQWKGKCDLVIGPHTFRDTAFYEVHYMQTSPVTPTLQTPSTSTSTTNPYAPYYGVAAQNTQTPATAAATSLSSSTPSEESNLTQIKLALGGGMEYTITSDLVARIHREASINPIFASKFRLAVDPAATQEQIRNFAFALPHLPGVRVSGVPTSLTLTTETVHLPPVREWDLVVEFSEAPTERWLIPRGTLASCSRIVNRNDNGLPDICLTLRLPVPEAETNVNANEPNTGTPPSETAHAVKYTLRRAPSSIYDLFLGWIGGDNKNEENAAALAKLSVRQKVFLSHRLTQGSLLSQLQAAQTPNYTMKPLKQGPTNPPRPRRKQAQKPKPKTQVKPTPAPAEATASTTSTTSITTTPAAPASPADATKTKEPKRRRYQPVSKPASFPIRCIVCFQTDVPLMMGGRYCRGCVDAGKANVAIPQLPRGSQTYTYTPYTLSATVTSSTVAASQQTENHATPATLPDASSVIQPPVSRDTSETTSSTPNNGASAQLSSHSS